MYIQPFRYCKAPGIYLHNGTTQTNAFKELMELKAPTRRLMVDDLNARNIPGRQRD
jgi:hypothetical protein